MCLQLFENTLDILYHTFYINQVDYVLHISIFTVLSIKCKVKQYNIKSEDNIILYCISAVYIIDTSSELGGNII